MLSQQSIRPNELILISSAWSRSAKLPEVNWQTLVGMQSLQPPDAAECHLKGVQADLRLMAIGEILVENMPEMEIHDPYQVENHSCSGL
jgi:hypothetical protein